MFTFAIDHFLSSTHALLFIFVPKMDDDIVIRDIDWKSGNGFIQHMIRGGAVENMYPNQTMK